MTQEFGSHAGMTVGASRAAQPWRGPGLTGRLLWLTAAFVMFAEVLIFIPSIANVRRMWLDDRLAAARIAATVRDTTPDGKIAIDLTRRLLQETGARAIVIEDGSGRRLIADGPGPAAGMPVFDMRDPSFLILVRDALQILFDPSEGSIRVIGPARTGSRGHLELVIDERALREAMLSASRNIALVSLAISALTAALMYLALSRLIVAPIHRMVKAVTAFERHPDDPRVFVEATARGDEIGDAERAIARMQRTLNDTLREKSHLAALGLAVAKINHELRNLLGAAQLMSDRLVVPSDAGAQRVVLPLMAIIDRAISYCESTLAYGRAAEPRPKCRIVAVAGLVDDMRLSLGLDETTPIRLESDVDHALTIKVDPDQIARVLLNLGRNAVEALSRPHAPRAEPPVLSVRAFPAATADEVEIIVRDNGPGLSRRARERLFEPFVGGARPGGTGLGLAIAAEIVQLNGGRIAIDPAVEEGVSVRLVLPAGRAV